MPTPPGSPSSPESHYELVPRLQLTTGNPDEPDFTVVNYGRDPIRNLTLDGSFSPWDAAQPGPGMAVLTTGAFWTYLFEGKSPRTPFYIFSDPLSVDLSSVTQLPNLDRFGLPQELMVATHEIPVDQLPDGIKQAIEFLVADPSTRQDDQFVIAADVGQVEQRVIHYLQRLLVKEVSEMFVDSPVFPNPSDPLHDVISALDGVPATHPKERLEQVGTRLQTLLRLQQGEVGNLEEFKACCEQLRCTVDQLSKYPSAESIMLHIQYLYRLVPQAQEIGKQTCLELADIGTSIAALKGVAEDGDEEERHSNESTGARKAAKTNMVASPSSPGALPQVGSKAQLEMQMGDFIQQQMPARQQVAALQQQLAALQQQLDALQQQVATLQQRNVLQEQVAALQQQLDTNVHELSSRQKPDHVPHS
jgi:hypothetical protein